MTDPQLIEIYDRHVRSLKGPHKERKVGENTRFCKLGTPLEPDSTTIE